MLIITINLAYVELLHEFTKEIYDLFNQSQKVHVLRADTHTLLRKVISRNQEHIWFRNTNKKENSDE